MTEKPGSKADKKPPRKEKPADQLTDKEVLKKLFPKEVRDVIQGSSGPPPSKPKG